MSQATILGYAPIMLTEDGQTFYDRDRLRRPGPGADDFGGEAGDDFGDDDFGDDDFGDDDFGDDDFGDDDFGDDDFGDDDFGDDDFEGEDFGDDDFGDDDEFGRRRRRRRGGRRRRRRRRGRRGRRAARPAAKRTKWGATAVSASQTLAAAGAVSAKIRLQHDFKAEDVTFTGSVANAKVTSIFFGDRVVWSNTPGIDVAVFASTGFMRGLLKGQQLKAGLDITVNGEVPGAGTFAATLTGKKPVASC